MKKLLPKGVSDFKKVIEKNRYYIDKTLLVKEILDSSDEVFVFPRPRRFGKTLNRTTSPPSSPSGLPFKGKRSLSKENRFEGKRPTDQKIP